MGSLLFAFHPSLGDWPIHATLFACSEVYTKKGHTVEEALSHPQCHCIQIQVTKPVPFPCFGVLKKEKHVLLPLVADIVVEQGYLQSLFGVYSLRIENMGVRRPPSDDVQIQGVANPNAFRKAVLTRLSSMKNEAFSRQVSAKDDPTNLTLAPSSASWMSPSKSIQYDTVATTGEQLLLQRLEEVGTSVKRVETLIEEQYTQASASLE
ncbi:uncharacterized protein LOC116197511 isoform X2 [Punica granatum]|uniref:Uncharacterized protein LOC116197511 isoform X2 n=1 Tax=Punica granatum TaxID=22663 RepID=A0A6P8CHJ2_PUNGR|nr:uncharacterized protein LOC116197511 isoform X2 [Punica granatum]